MSRSPGNNSAQPLLRWGGGAITALLAGAVVSFIVVEWLADGVFDGRATGAGEVHVSSDFTLEDAREFDGFSIYWVGESFQGLPLDALYKVRSPGVPGYEDITASDVVALDYGTCQIPPGQTGCPVPLSIIIYPYCTHPPETLHNSVKVGPPMDMRGATVQYTGASDLGLWTGDVAVSVHGPSPEVTKAVVENLVALTSDGPKSASEDLGPATVGNCPELPYSTGKPVESHTEEP